MVTAAAAGGAIVDDPASALASGSSAPAGGADLKEVTIQKGPRGFGFSTDDEGVITGAGGPAADAGVPAGSRIVAVAGVAVGSKPEIIAQLRALGSDVVEVQFTLQLSSAFGSAGADGGNVAI
jgi:predicted metalloprotease with PDZ domain